MRRLPWDAHVLRGSLLTRQWVAPFPRRAGDLDLAGKGDDRVEATADALLPPLAADVGDGVAFRVEACRATGIWRETPGFPGVRLALRAVAFDRPVAVTVDVGFGDPLVPPAEPFTYAPLVGTPIDVRAVARTTMVAWKLHGLAEWGEVRWRPKDLLDLWLLTPLDDDPDTVAGALRAAFTSRGFDPRDAERVLAGAWWAGPAAQMRWRRFLADDPRIDPPRNPATLRDAVRERLAPAFARL
ncbi:MAG: nucleotidyl transferase AbiEii/AbiGii toxin family protein [Alphaproteobacteria bacterium]|nr:nucleotidyl transferase AbiEii/AbiGii toxin family protein [Alphaproteobacteria bacterium]